MGGQDIGSIVKNLGTKPNGGFGNMFITNLIHSVPSPQSDILSEVQTGPTFDLHHMVQTIQSLTPDNGFRNGLGNDLTGGFQLGHFRDREHLDIFVTKNWRIYWADDNGNYDSTRFSVLKPHIRPGDFQDDGGIGGQIINPYITHFTNDTTDDIITTCYSDYIDNNDTLFLLLYRSSPLLDLKDTIYEDTSAASYTLSPDGSEYRYSAQGDFRGVGRDDLIIWNDSLNFTYIKNDQPFNIGEMAQEMWRDTLMTRWQNPILATQYGWALGTLTMRALPKNPGDNSVDWLPGITVDTQPNPELFFFRGGPEFGSHRITLDSAAYVLPDPGFGGVFNRGAGNCGDMTGTGNNVIGVGGVNSDFFFVTGQALDPYVDMELQWNQEGGGGPSDTLTANSDSLEDLLIGAFAYYTPTDVANGDTSESGSLWILYGSKQIPVRLNSQWADVKDIPQQNGAGIIFSPNPVTNGWSVATIVWPEGRDAVYEVQNVLGAVVQSGTLRMLGGAEQQRIYFSNLASGVYYITIRGTYAEARTKLVIAH
jgi:hypothetical protein